MNITVNNNNHQINFGLENSGIITAGLDNEKQRPFGDFLDDIKQKAEEDAEWENVVQIFQIPEIFLLQAQSRQAFFGIMERRFDAIAAGDNVAREGLINLFHQFGLSKFLQPGVNAVELFYSMSPSDRTAFIRMEEYLLNRG